MKMNQFTASHCQKWVVECYLIVRQVQKSCVFALSFSV
ncbi:hypothetical protein A5880_002251 [Enterococcus sp. 4G2_DIV0659]|uniref:Uncharacterized protein n=1 Tax=Candidatus Enterococcus mansonii TaxID=1834181 RepID=A0A242CGY5_9ENTE|nr:hypothetical protein A5880_000155 [Enterococcus sp. 4G2_DIV0659]